MNKRYESKIRQYSSKTVKEQCNLYQINKEKGADKINEIEIDEINLRRTLKL